MRKAHNMFGEIKFGCGFVQVECAICKQYLVQQFVYGAVGDKAGALVALHEDMLAHQCDDGRPEPMMPNINVSRLTDDDIDKRLDDMEKAFEESTESFADILNSMQNTIDQATKTIEAIHTTQTHLIRDMMDVKANMRDCMEEKNKQIHNLQKDLGYVAFLLRQHLLKENPIKIDEFDVRSKVLKRIQVVGYPEKP